MRANPQRFSFNKIFSAYFNAAERRLIVRSVIIGALVWAVVFALRAVINWSFYGIVQWVEAGPSLWLMLVPLAAGALGMAFFSHYHTSTVQSLQGGDLLLLLGEDHLLDQFAADAMEIT
jgi:hypothetical protein